jgi:hypothetical protein
MTWVMWASMRYRRLSCSLSLGMLVECTLARCQREVVLCVIGGWDSMPSAAFTVSIVNAVALRVVYPCES